MGSTGRNIHNYFDKSLLSTETFGISNAVIFKGNIPERTGLETIGSNKITLKIPTISGNDILLQFKLTKDLQTMNISGFKNGIPEVKARVGVDVKSPSLDTVMRAGSRADRLNAGKIKDLMGMIIGIGEYQLSAIAQELLNKHRERRN